jgi:hypothetical protein
MQSDIFYDDAVPDGVMTVYNPDGSVYKRITFEKW